MLDFNDPKPIFGMKITNLNALTKFLTLYRGKIEEMLNSLPNIANGNNSAYYSIKKNFAPLNFARSNKNYLFAFISNHLIYYPTPISLTYAWSFGFLAGMCLLTQMISGIFLAMVWL